MLPAPAKTAPLDAYGRPGDLPSRGAAPSAAPISAWLAAACLGAFAVSVLARDHIGLGAPFWLDESWTGAFAAQPSFGALLGQTRDDSNAPLYYTLIWGWAKLFGVSDLALRLPSLGLGLAAPALAWLSLRGTSPALRLAWAGLVAVWIPGIALSGYARCYPLLLGVSVVATGAYVRLLQGPSLRRAVVWATAASLMTLTHYHAGVLALAQGVTLLAILRRRAWPLWPAALAFLPAFAWIAWHAPRLAQFARPDIAWYNRLTLGDIPAAADFVVGARLAFSVVAASALLAALLRRRTGARPASASPAAPAIAGVVALSAAAVCLLIGMMRPSLALRYLTPIAPGALLLAAWTIERMSRGRREPLAALVGGFALVAALVWIVAPRPEARLYNFETASAWIAPTRPQRLVFFWDHPQTPVEVPAQLDAVGGFFLRRAGLPLRVVPLFPVRTGGDVNPMAFAAAHGARGAPPAAVIWLYDTGVHGTSATAHPPRPAGFDPALECRDFGAGPIGVFACRPRTAPDAA